MNISHWNFDYYCTYVLLCLASSDHDLEQEELKTINTFLNDQKIANPDSLINELLVVIKYQTIPDRINFIEINFPSFVDSKDKAHKLVDIIEELIMSDFTIAPDEMELYRVIKKKIRKLN